MISMLSKEILSIFLMFWVRVMHSCQAFYEDIFEVRVSKKVLIMLTRLAHWLCHVTAALQQFLEKMSYFTTLKMQPIFQTQHQT